VIVPAHNSSAYILRTLRSIEASVHHLLLTHNRGREVREASAKLSLAAETCAHCH
jgi:hypothetical protein